MPTPRALFPNYRYPPTGICYRCGQKVSPRSTFCGGRCREADRQVRIAPARVFLSCAQCGAPLGIERRLDITTCSRRCAARLRSKEYNRRRRAERREAQKDRPQHIEPCVGCGTDIVIRTNKKYCSISCGTNYRYRKTHPKRTECLWCKMPMSPKRSDTLYCGHPCGDQANFLLGPEANLLPGQLVSLSRTYAEARRELKSK